jgi:glycine/D-amino acid oxidase-like deaminating enzyme
LLMAPGAGRAIAGWIGGGNRPDGLGAFSLGRFA